MAEFIPQKDLHRIVTTCIVYRDDGTYLIKKRRPDREPFPGRWEVPGGGLEAKDYQMTVSENPDGWEDVLDDVVRREVSEEVGLVVGDLRYLGNSIFIRKDGVPVLVLRYAAPYVSGVVTLDDEATEYAWIRASGAHDYGLIGSIPNDLQKLDQALALDTI